MNRCEDIQIELSAVVDGEADTEALPSALDHLLRCADCQRFYRGCRRVEDVAGEARRGAQIERLLAATAINDDRQGAFPLRLPALRRRLIRPRFMGIGAGRVGAWRAAAMVIMAVGLFTLGRGAMLTGAALSPTQDVVVRLEEDRGKMSDERFVELTVELLRSDRRYHEKMLEIMNGVAPEHGAPESTYLGAAALEGEDDRDRVREEQL